MRYLVLLLLALLGCEAPLTEEEMAKRYPPIAEPRSPVPLVAPVIPRTGGWSGDNQLGYMAKYAPNQRATQTILKLDEWGPPEIWTISLYLEQKFAVFDGFNVRARINFGAGGSTQVYECDWINGTQISLPMNAVNVEAIFRNVDVTTEGAGLVLGAQLARGARGGTNPPVLTLAEDVAPASLAEGLVIPNFAKAIVVYPTSVVAANNDPFFTSASSLQLISGTGGAPFASSAILGTRASEGRLRLPVIGHERRVLYGYSGGAPEPNVSVYAELDG